MANSKCLRISECLADFETLIHKTETRDFIIAHDANIPEGDDLRMVLVSWNRLRQSSTENNI